jgi:hypothetical protein
MPDTDSLPLYNIVLKQAYVCFSMTLLVQGLMSVHHLSMEATLLIKVTAIS